MIRFTEWLRIREGLGVGPYIGDCRPTDDYQVFGACSDQNSEKKNAKIRDGREGDRPKKKQNNRFREN